MLDQITDEMRASEEYLRLYDGIGKRYGFKTKTNDYAINTSSLSRMTDEEKEIYLHLPPLRWIEQHQFYVERRIPWLVFDSPK